MPVRSGDGSTPAVIGYCPKCGNTVYVAVIETYADKRAVGVDVLNGFRAGRTYAWATVDVARASDWCECKRAVQPHEVEG